MSRIKARLLADDQFVVDSQGCGTCVGCGAGASRQLRLPGQTSSEVDLELSSLTQWSLLWNSWLKPLGGLVIASLICAILQAGELVSVIVVTVTFLISFFGCRELPADSLSITEVMNAPR